MMQPRSICVEIISLPDLIPDLIGCLRESGVPFVQVQPGILRCNKSIEAITVALQQFSGVEVRHYLDRYVLVLPLDTRGRQYIADEFFIHIAQGYEYAVDIERNRDNILKLFVMLQSYNLEDSAVVVDYGCGTGLSLAVTRPATWRIVGVDRCPVMRAIAAPRGMHVIAPEQLHQKYPDGISAAFCSYVFHLIFDLSDLGILWSSICTGGVVAANFHKGVGESLITDYLTAHGARVDTPQIVDDKNRHGLYRVYVKE